MITCEYCGKKITAKSHKKGGTRRFCNNECYKAARNPADYQLTICKYCGKIFREKRDSINFYCSKRCTGKAISEDATKARTESEAIEREEREHREVIRQELLEALEVVEHLRFRNAHGRETTQSTTTGSQRTESQTRALR